MPDLSLKEISSNVVELVNINYITSSVPKKSGLTFFGFVYAEND